MLRVLIFILAFMLASSAVSTARAPLQDSGINASPHVIVKDFRQGAMRYDAMFQIADSNGKSIGSQSIAGGVKGLCILVKLRLRIEGWRGSPLRYSLNRIEDYEDRLKYFAFHFTEGVTLQTDSASCPKLASEYISNLNGVPFETFLLLFRLPESVAATASPLSLYIDDAVFYKDAFQIILTADELKTFF